jgi:AraC-like DNA-binding protein
MLVFDSASVPSRDRHSALVDSITSAASATFMTPDRGAESLHLKMNRWDLGGVEVIDTKCSAHTLRRSPRQTARGEVPMLAITCGLKGSGVHRQLDREVKVQPAGVWATDLSLPYIHRVTDTWTTTAKIPFSMLGVPRELVSPALEHLNSSPLARVFSHHLADVRQIGDDVNDAAVASLGTATLALARALLISVSGDDGLRRGALEDILLLRVKAYVREHLRDSSLDPATIAAANHVSVRMLYKTCARANLQLEQWIIEQRLERAREDLARSTTTHVSVTGLGQRWGFASASHFARRFRSAYGMSPREWQALNRTARERRV